MSEPSANSSLSKRRFTLRSFDALAVRSIAIFAVVFFGVVIWRIATAPIANTDSSNTGTLVQMAQWAISTVLAGGAVLIGLNWYQGEKRYQSDAAEINARVSRMETRIEASIGAFEARFQTIERTSDELISALIEEQYRDLVESDDWEYVVGQLCMLIGRASTEADKVAQFAVDRLLQRIRMRPRPLSEGFALRILLEQELPHIEELFPRHANQIYKYILEDSNKLHPGDKDPTLPWNS